jgi:hypothetical protein
MPNILQVRYDWTGFTGAPGYSNLHFRSTTGDATEALAAVTKGRLLFTGLPFNLPSSVHIANSTDVRLLDEATGDLVDIFTVTGLSEIVGGSAAVYSGSSGMCVDWLTTTVHRSRRLQGRTFMVPLAGDQYQTDGSPAAGAITRLASSAEAMRTASGPAFGVWGRPVGGAGGVWGPAVSSRVPDKAVVLRSRRA